MRILSVDDNAINLKLLRAVLEAEGYEILEAKDGLEALAILELEKVDVIISDILMPNMDGYKLCYEVRKSARFGHLPFITYTSTYTSPSDERFALEVGADKYLRKPAQAHVLLETLEEFASNPRYREPRGIKVPINHDLMQTYSEVLVQKLQEKNAELEQVKDEIMKLNEALEARVKQRTTELELVNQELDAFCHSAAHDLRAPIRAIDGYGYLLQQSLEGRLDSQELHHIERIRQSAKKMHALIEDLLKLSFVGKCEIEHRQVDLSALTESLLNDLAALDPERAVQIQVEPGYVCVGDASLLEIAILNVASNAWKFTSKNPNARITGSKVVRGGFEVWCIRDNGAGFEMKDAERLFKPFERMHSQDSYPGTGLGLTIVRRILLRHGGEVSIESQPDVGTSVYLRLPST